MTMVTWAGRCTAIRWSNCRVIAFSIFTGYSVVICLKPRVFGLVRAVRAPCRTRTSLKAIEIFAGIRTVSGSVFKSDLRGVIANPVVLNFFE